MADDVNKPRGGSRGDNSNLDKIFQRLERAQRPGIQELRLRAVRERLNQRMEQEVNKVHGDPSYLQESLEQLTLLGRPYDTIERALAGEEAARQASAGKAFQTGVRQFTGERATTARIRGVSQSAQGLGEAMRMSQQESYADLQRRNEMSAARGAELRERFQELSEDPNIRRGTLQQVASGILQHERSAAITGSAMSSLRRRGLSTGSLLEEGFKSTSAINQARRHSGIISDVQAGVGPLAGSMGQRQKALDDATESMLKAFEKFEKAVESNADNLGELESAYKQAKSEFQERQVAAAAGPSSGGGFLEQVAKFFTNKTTGAVLQGGGEALRQTGRMSRFFGVELPIRRAEVQAGFSDLANRQYEDYRSGLESYDIAAARRLMTVYNGASGFGGGVGTAENLAIMQEVLGQGMLDTNAAVNSFASTNVGGGVAASARGAGNLTQGAALGFTGIQGGERNIAAQLTQLRLQDSLNLIRDTNSQSFIDFSTSAGLASRGLGGAREGVLQSIMRAPSMQGLARAGINQSAIPGLIQQGGAALGGQFDGFNTLRRAGRLQQAGVISTQGFLQQAGQLAGVGGGEESLERAISQLVAATMDNARSIQEMTSATVQLSSEFAAAGEGAAVGQADILAAQVQGMRGIGERQRMAIAQRASSFMNEAGSDRSMNIFTVQRAAMTRAAFGDLPFSAFEAATVAPPNAIRGIRSALNAGDNEQALELARRSGLGRVLTDPSNRNQLSAGRLESLEEISRVTTMRRLLSFGKVNKAQESAVMDAVRAGRSFGELETENPEAARALEELGITSRGGRVSGRAVFEGVSRGLSAAEIKAGAPVEKGELASSIEQSEVIKSKAASKPILSGLENLGGDFTGALNKLNATFEALNKNFSPKAMQESAINAAKDFEAPAIKINEAAGTFERAAVIFKDAVESNYVFDNNSDWINNQQAVKKKAQDYMDQLKKSSGN